MGPNIVKHYLLLTENSNLIEQPCLLSDNSSLILLLLSGRLGIGLLQISQELPEIWSFLGNLLISKF